MIRIVNLYLFSDYRLYIMKFGSGNQYIVISNLLGYFKVYNDSGICTFSRCAAVPIATLNNICLSRPLNWFVNGVLQLFLFIKNKNKKFIVDPNTNSYIIQIHQINQ